MLSVGYSRSWFPVVYMYERSVVGSGHRLWVSSLKERLCRFPVSSWSSWSRGLGKSGSKISREKVGEDFDGFRREVEPPDKIGQGGPRAEQGRGASPTVHNTNPSVITIGILLVVLFVCPSSFLDTRGVEESSSRYFHFVLSSPSHLVGRWIKAHITRAPIKDNPLQSTFDICTERQHVFVAMLVTTA